jgi:divalent metal cation (Fe/Co/Zn/Cd) transporter
MIMACNILISGGGLVRSSFGGLMDRADPATHQKLTDILARESKKCGLSYHHLRHRNLGDAHWVEVHLVFPDDWSLAQAHREATRVEQLIEQSLEPRAYITTHLENASDHDELHPHEQVGNTGAAGKDSPRLRS